MAKVKYKCQSEREQGTGGGYWTVSSTCDPVLASRAFLRQAPQVTCQVAEPALRCKERAPAADAPPGDAPTGGAEVEPLCPGVDSGTCAKGGSVARGSRTDWPWSVLGAAATWTPPVLRPPGTWPRPARSGSGNWGAPRTNERDWRARLGPTGPLSHFHCGEAYCGFSGDSSPFCPPEERQISGGWPPKFLGGLVATGTRGMLCPTCVLSGSETAEASRAQPRL